MLSKHEVGRSLVMIMSREKKICRGKVRRYHIIRRRVSLDRYLEEAGQTQRELARQLGISKSHLSMIVNGDRQPSLPLALLIEEVTGVPVATLAVMADSDAKAEPALHGRTT